MIKISLARGIKISWWLLCLSCFNSCVSTYTALERLPLGSNKKTVRNVVGKPYFVGRNDGRDQWTYKFKWHAQEYTQNILFEEGLVQKIGPLTPYPNYERKMLEAESLEDYEANAALLKQQKESGFRKINSLKQGDKVKSVSKKPVK